MTRTNVIEAPNPPFPAGALERLTAIDEMFESPRFVSLYTLTEDAPYRFEVIVGPYRDETGEYAHYIQGDNVAVIAEMFREVTR